MCFGHHGRWRREGTPDLAGSIATTPGDWNGRRQLASCKVPACQYASSSKGMCERHHAQWKRSGEAGHASWMASAAPLRPPSPVPPICAIVYCALWCKGRAPFCSGHNGYWRQCRSRMSMKEFTALYEADRSGQEWIDLRNLPAQLRLEVQYVLQSPRDGAPARVQPPAGRCGWPAPPPPTLAGLPARGATPPPGGTGRGVGDPRGGARHPLVGAGGCPPPPYRRTGHLPFGTTATQARRRL